MRTTIPASDLSLGGPDRKVFIVVHEHTEGGDDAGHEYHAQSCGVSGEREVRLSSLSPWAEGRLLAWQCVCQYMEVIHEVSLEEQE